MLVNMVLNNRLAEKSLRKWKGQVLLKFQERAEKNVPIRKWALLWWYDCFSKHQGHAEKLCTDL